MLMGISLSNLACLYAKHGKVYKALAIALKAIGILEWHLQELKARKDRDRLTEDVVVFVNALMVTQSTLRKILRGNNKTFFKSLFKIVNRLGYSFANRYLGEESPFTRKFYLPEDSVLLPVYKSEPDEEETEQNRELNEFEVRIAKELENIYNSLKELNLEPEVYYIREHVVEEKSKVESSIIPAEP
jgi:transcriptional regulator with XRE-family HTH domain